MYLNPYQAGFYTFLMICMSLRVCVCDLFPLYFLIYLFNHLFIFCLYMYISTLIYTQNICILQYLFVPRCSKSRSRNVPLQNQAHFVEALKRKS